MTTFYVRIELHSHTANYEQLHTWMASAGFNHTIRGSNGIVYKLPTATYSIEISQTADGLRDWLSKNMPSCGSNPLPWILVIESASSAWVNLRQVS